MFVVIKARSDIPLVIPFEYTNQIRNTQIYDIAELDKEIYISTSKGLFKYNGQELIHFSTADGLKDDEVFNLQVHQDTLWFCSIMGRLFFLPKNQRIIQEYTAVKEYIKTFFWHNNYLYYANNRSELHVWNVKNKTQQYIGLLPSILDYKVKQSKLFLLHTEFEYSILDLNVKKLIKKPSKSISNGYSVPIRNKQTPLIDAHLYSFFKDKLCVIDINLQTQEVLTVKPNTVIYTILPLQNEIIVGTQQGLFQVQGKKVECILPDIFATNIFLDSENTVWITTFSGEIYLIPNLNLRTSPFIDRAAVQQVRKLHLFKGNVIYGTNTGEVFLNHQPFKAITKNYEAGKLNRILNITDDGNKVYITRDDGFFICDIKNKTAQYISTKFTIKRTFVNSFPYYVIGAYYAVVLMDKKTHKILKQFSCPRIADIILWQDKPLLCTYNNVYIVHSDSLQEILKQRYKSSKIRFAYYDSVNRHLYLAHQKGIDVYDSQLNCLHQIQIGNNNDINKIQIHKNRIYIATIKGLFILPEHSPQSQALPVQNVYNLNIYDIRIQNDTLHFISDVGYSYTPISALTHSLPNILIEYKIKNTNYAQNEDKIIIRYPDNSLQISIIPKTIKYRTKINYQYSITGEGKTQTTPYAFLSIPFFHSGMYQVKITSLVENHPIRQDVLKVHFVLPIWKDKNFKVFALIIGLISLLLIYMEHLIRREKQKAFQEKQQNQALKYQLQAVQSRLNPHFIFNGLQSLQYLVVSNQNTLAKAYLNDFASLTRKFLTYSQQEFCSIEEEIAILKNYLNLENIAHNNQIKYEFILQLEDEMMFQQPIIPSLILQPLVENIFKHAFTENYPSPQIEIRFIENVEKQRLIVEIEDNGIGMSKEILPHSKGLQLIMDRLKIINQTYKTQHYLEILPANKFSSGTLCRLIFQFKGV
ncbi:MAG: histidine kinase [Bacteroidia bacterium]|nr:histidine kinase [Bacteroidia bacterium]